MNMKLSYNGKTLDQMTTEELKRQCRVNRTRLKIRLIFWVAILLLTFFTVPFVLPVVGAIAAITTFWLLQKNKAIQYELGKRR